MNWNELFRYDPETGKLYWKVDVGTRARAGNEAGFLNKSKGYMEVGVGGRLHKAHRVIWDLTFQSDKLGPDDEIDHINHIRSDNRLVNLRKATCAMNSRNKSKRKDNTSGVTGVHWHKAFSKWGASIAAEGVRVSLGLFADKKDAIAARKAAELEYGYHENHGAANAN